MRRSILSAVALVLVIGMASVSGVEPKAAKGVLAGLRVGQPVALKDLGTAYEVRVTDDKLPTEEVVAEVGDDYLVVKSVAGIETRIPLSSLKAVVVVLAR